MSAIYDLSRHRMILFPTRYFELVTALDGSDLSEVGKIYDGSLDDSQKIDVMIKYLLASEVATMVTEPSRFPKLETSFRQSSTIHNAIVDVDSTWHDFPSIINELDQLGCEFLQVRIFSKSYSMDRIRELVSLADHTSIKGIDLLIRHNSDCEPGALKCFVAAHSILTHLIVHSSPVDLAVQVDPENAGELGLSTGRVVQFITHTISSSSSCGNITINSINAPSPSIYTELLHHNGCLNKKISIDVDGQIKNCPSFCESYGKIGTSSLARVINDSRFRRVWNIAKDKISVCRDCQFRYACTDCRAYVEDASDLFSKPARCGYDPYRDVWVTPPADGQLIVEDIRTNQLSV